jgi:DNA-binding CsgD family transcriptional regulator
MKLAKGRLKMPDKPLTPREIEVMTLTAMGKTRIEVAAILFLSEETIKSHIERVRRKLNATNKTHAIAIAMTLGLIEPYQRPGH